MPDRPFSLSVKMLVRDNENRWLFIQRSRKSKWNPGMWDLPGGKVDPGESFRDGLLREVREETGLDVFIHSLYGAIEDETDKFKVVHVVMNGKCITGEVRLSSEHEDYKWVSSRDALDLELCDFVRLLIESADKI